MLGIQSLDSGVHRRVPLLQRLHVAPLVGGIPLLLSLSACEAETLYPDVDVGGDEVVLAPHTVSVRTAEIPQRLQVGDVIPVEVTARSRDGASGIARVGATLLVRTAAGMEPITLGPAEIAPARTGPVTVRFELPIDTALARRFALPGTVSFETHGFALTARETCVAAVESTKQQLPCGDLNGHRIAAGATGSVIQANVVAGMTVPLAAGSSIADMVVDPRSGKVFLSNRSAHRVEVLDIPSLQLRSPVRVGSEPWGLAMNRTGDTLIVANSGGTNISFVPTASLREDVARRFDLPRVRLYDFNVQEDSLTGEITVEVDLHSYTDRPHSLAQDAAGRLLYSVVPTEAAPVGTIRVAQWQDGWNTWDLSLLFPDGSLASTPLITNRAVTASDSADIAIANVDSVTMVFDSAGPFAGWTGRVVLWDHRPGRRPADADYLIRTEPLTPVDAIHRLRELGSDVLAYVGYRWNLPEAAEVADTTFVAASGDRNRIVFGELPQNRAGRILLWDATIGGLSRVGDIRDLVNNTSDRITGVDLNQDGSLGVAHGQRASYFFSEDLRLRGLTAGGEGRGVSLYPNSTDRQTLAFVGTGRGTIEILETTHYRRVGEVPIRDPLVGPLRVMPAQGPSACPAYDQGTPDCVVARAYGVTSAGVVVVDILRRYLTLE